MCDGWKFSASRNENHRTFGYYLKIATGVGTIKKTLTEYKVQMKGEVNELWSFTVKG